MTTTPTTPTTMTVRTTPRLFVDIRGENVQWFAEKTQTGCHATNENGSKNNIEHGGPIVNHSNYLEFWLILCFHPKTDHVLFIVNTCMGTPHFEWHSSFKVKRHLTSRIKIGMNWAAQPGREMNRFPCWILMKWLKHMRSDRITCKSCVAVTMSAHTNIIYVYIYIYIHRMGSCIYKWCKCI